MTLALGIDPGAVTGFAVARVPRIGAVEVVDMYAVRDRAVDHFDDLLQVHHRDVDLVCVESIATVYPKIGAGGKGIGSRMASHLAASARIAGELVGHARGLGFAVVECSALQWRKAICGQASTTDARVKQALQLRCGGKLPRSNAHERDALGCAIWGGLTQLHSRSGMVAAPSQLPRATQSPPACQVREIRQLSAERDIERDSSGMPTRLFIGRS